MKLQVSDTKYKWFPQLNKTTTQKNAQKYDTVSLHWLFFYLKFSSSTVSVDSCHWRWSFCPSLLTFCGDLIMLIWPPSKCTAESWGGKRRYSWGKTLCLNSFTEMLMSRITFSQFLIWTIDAVKPLIYNCHCKIQTHTPCDKKLKW